jgi:hypothetical protein
MPCYKVVYADWTYKNDIIVNSEMLSKSLEAKVEALMKEGWTCVGGVGLFTTEGILYNMYQAMVKTSK